MSLFDEKNLAGVTDEAHYPGEWLVVYRNPALERARQCEELRQAPEAELDKVVAATRRAKRRF